MILPHYLCRVNKTLLSHLALLTVALIYGANYNIAKLVMNGFLGAFGFIVIRVTGAGLLFLMVYLLFNREKVERKDMLPLFISSCFGVAGNMLMFFKGLSLTSPINASVLMLNAPVFVIIFSAIIYKTRPQPAQIAGIIIAFAGAFWMIASKNNGSAISSSTGDIFILLNATSYAFYLVYVKRLIVKYKSLTVVTFAFLFGIPLVWPFGFSDIQSADFSHFPEYIWWAVGFVVLGTTFVAYLFNAWALQNTAPAVVGSYIYLQPIIASGIAIALQQDVLSVQKIAAGLLVFCGVFMVSYFNRVKPEA